MQGIVLIRALPDGACHWYRFDAGLAPEQRQGQGSLADFKLALGHGKPALCLLLPGDRVSTRIEPLVWRERRHLRQSVPYQLEESLLGDIDRLHFAFGECAEMARSDGDASVACGWCDRDWLAEILQPFRDLELDLRWVVPEPLLLQRQQGWTLRWEEKLWCHIDAGYGFAVDPALATQALSLLCSERGIPGELILSAATESDMARLRACLPDSLQTEAAERIESLWLALEPAAIAWMAHSSGPELNLLQQDFAPRLPLQRWWRQWRAVASLCVIALSAWAVEGIVQLQQQQLEALQLQAQIEQAFRSVVPRGELVDAEKQLQHRLQSLGGNADYAGPVSLMARLAPALGEGEGIALSGLSYDVRQGDLRLSCRARTFADIEQLRNRLLQAGLEAELVHASADAEGQQARFRIRWRQT